MGEYSLDNPWSTRYGWIWYNTKEIWQDTQEDIDCLVKSYADKGINVLIGFSCTHFRWSFYRHWEVINECIKKIVSACHKYNILYVEHHSSHLTFNPKSEQDLAFMHSMMQQRESAVSDWPHMLEDSQSDFLYDGRPIHKWRQISGKSGTYGITTYRGYGMCFNNPLYREAYTAYLEDLYALGIDGIMTDDIQYFGNDGMGWKQFNACTCEYCRQKFFKEYGFELPSPQEWEDFYWNFDNPVFIAWKKFKDDSTLRFVHFIRRHYIAKGYAMFRPNYISEILTTNKTALPFERCSEIWDVIFQENGTGCIIKESYLSFGLEALHRYNMARRHNVPSMSMFYPVSNDALYFSFALAKAWGQLYTNCAGEGVTEELDEEFIRSFEEKHIDMYTNPQKIADLAFILSTNTRDYSKDCEQHQHNLLRWLQAAYLTDISVDMIFEDQFEDYDKYDTLVCAHTVMLSDEVMQALENWVSKGGHLITIGDFGKYKENGSERETVINIKRTVLEDSQCWGSYHWYLIINRYTQDMKNDHIQVPPYSVEKLKQSGGQALLEAIDKKTVITTHTKQEVYTSLFRAKNAYALHIVNTQDTISKSGSANHYLPIEAYKKGATNIMHDIDIELDLGLDLGLGLGLGLDLGLDFVTLHTPESDKSIPLAFTILNNKVHIKVPKNTFAGYALIFLKPKGPGEIG